MATGSPNDVLIVPGRLYADADSTDPDDGPPYGGTELGFVKDIAVKPVVTHENIKNSEFGVEILDKIYVGEVWIVTCTLMTYDPDMLAKIYPNISTGSVSGKPLFTYPGSFLPGTRLAATKAFSLLFAAEDVERDPSFVLYRVLPMLVETAELNFSSDLSKGEEFRCQFVATRDGSDRLAQKGLFVDLTLT